jgi:hypothetical protein
MQLPVLHKRAILYHLSILKKVQVMYMFFDTQDGVPKFKKK